MLVSGSADLLEAKLLVSESCRANENRFLYTSFRGIAELCIFQRCLLVLCGTDEFFLD